MPVHLKLPLPGGAILALWRINEEETLLTSLCTAAEQQEAAAFAAPRRRLEYLAWHALLHALLPEAHAAHDPEGGPVLVFPSSQENTPADIPAELPHRQDCTRPDTGLRKNARSENIPSEHTRFGDPLQTGEFAPLRHIGVSHSHGYAAVILSSQPCAVDIEPADTDFSRTARRFISPQEQALQPYALPETLFPALVWCAKETVYKWVRISGLSLLHDIRVTEIRPEQTEPYRYDRDADPESASKLKLNPKPKPEPEQELASKQPQQAQPEPQQTPESVRTNPSGPEFPTLKTFHRLTVTAAGKTLQLHGFTAEGICCVYGIG